MIIGLAVQRNIAAIFSGIILNLERAFSIGDYVKISNVSGQIVDITWRTICIQHDDGEIVSLPNGRATDVEIYNYSRAPSFWTKLALYVDSAHPPDTIAQMIAAGIPENPFIITENVDPPFAVFAGVECIGGHWVSRYNIGFAVKTRPNRRKAIQDLWLRTWQRFQDAHISWPAIESEVPHPYPAIEVLK